MSSVSPAPSPVSAFRSDELRLKAQKEQLERRNESDLRDIRAKQNDEVLGLMDNHAFRIDSLKKSYEVRFVEEQEKLAQKLSEIHEEKDKKLELEKLQTEKELETLKFADQKRIEQYKKNAEAEYANIQKQYKDASQNLHEQSIKMSKKAKITERKDT
jgi:hypothetical protein